MENKKTIELPANQNSTKRVAALFIDMVIVTILELILFAVLIYPLAKKIGNYTNIEQELKTSINTKFNYLDSLNVIEKASEEDKDIITTNYDFTYYNSEHETNQFLSSYLLDENLINKNYDSTKPSYDYENNIHARDNNKWNDNLMNYYLELSPILSSKYSITTSKFTSYSTPYEYYQYLSYNFNTSTYKIFVYDGEKQVPVINDEDGSSSTPDNYSIKKQLRLYLGGQYLLDGEKQSETTVNKEIYNIIKSSYNKTISSITEEVLNTSLEYENEKTIVVLNNKMANISSLSILLSYSLAFILYFSIFQCIFKSGMTVGKKVFNFMVVSRNDKRAKVWQILIRDIGLYFEYFWISGFVSVVLYRLSFFSAPLFIFQAFTITLPTVILISFCLMIISMILSLLIRKYMLSLHDLISYTKCIRLQEGLNIKNFIESQKENDNLKENDNSNKEDIVNE